MKLNIKTAALSFGILFGLGHLVWVILVGIFGEGVMEFIAGLHFVDFTALPFNFGWAILGVILAFVWGLVVGAVFAWIWNKFEK